MVFVDIKIASIVTDGHEAPKAKGLYYKIISLYYVISKSAQKMQQGDVQHFHIT